MYYTLLFCFFCFFFFFNDTATTEIYTLSLHDALPILPTPSPAGRDCKFWQLCASDRKSTRLNSSHTVISYAVFCLKKKKKKKKHIIITKKKKKQKNKTIKKYEM